MEDVKGWGGGGGDGWKTNTTLYVSLGLFCLPSYVCPSLFFIQGCQKVLK